MVNGSHVVTATEMVCCDHHPYIGVVVGWTSLSQSKDNVIGEWTHSQDPGRQDI